jgi:hypothetical protein
MVPDASAKAAGSIRALPAPIVKYLRRFHWRKKQLAILRAFGRAIAAGLLWGIIWCLVDRFARLGSWTRTAALATGLAMILWIILRSALRAFIQSPQWTAVAADIEKRRPEFGQRLMTLVSEAMFPPRFRASDGMLALLQEEVSHATRSHSPTSLLPWRRALRPWVTTLFIALGAFGLTRVDWLQMPTLARRLIYPLSAIPAVTTTRIEVLPGDVDVIQGDALEIAVSVQRLIGSSVDLEVSHDGRNFTSIDMPTELEGRHVFRFSSIDRDLTYRISAGDASSDRYRVRVLRRPAVAEFKVRYDFPPYIARPPVETITTDGFIEAPIGTNVKLAIRSVEPLRQCALYLGDAAIATTPTTDASIWEASFVVDRDLAMSLEMVSNHGVSGRGPGGMLVRAVPDRPPTVRLALEGDELRFHPRDVVALPYVAADDYGMASLGVQLQVNSAPVAGVSIPILDVGRREEGVCQIDLAPLKIQIGDVISFNLVAEDRAGQKSVTEMRHVLISPRSVDLNAHLRLGEMKYAVRLGEMLVSEVESAIAAFDQARGSDRPDSWYAASARSRMNQHIVTVSETTTLLRLTLLRVILRSASPAMSDGLANLLDATQPQATLVEEVSRLRDVTPENPQAIHDRLRLSLTQATELLSRIQTLMHGQLAMVILADRENLAASERSGSDDPSQMDRRAATLKRAIEDISRNAASIGLDSNAPDLDAQLKARVDQAAAWIQDQKPVDYALAAAQWDVSLNERLGVAAQAEAVRPDANLVRARDLQLASRAASAIDRDDNQAARGEFPAALLAFDAEHCATRTADVVIDAAIRQTADAAREKMSLWAGDRDAVVPADATPPSQPSAQELAMQASAEAASRNYERAAELDRRLASRRSSIQGEEEWENQLRVQRAMSAAKQIDELNVEQEKVRAATAAAMPEQVAAIAQRQKELATTIQQVREEQMELFGEPRNSTRPQRTAKAIATLIRISSQIQAMPSQLATVKQEAAGLTAATQAKTEAAATRQKNVETQAAAVALKDKAVANQQQMATVHQQAVAAQQAATEAQKIASTAVETARAQLATAMSSTQPAATQPSVDPTLQQAVDAAQQALTQSDAALAEATRLMNEAASRLTESEAALAAATAAADAMNPQIAAADQAMAVADKTASDALIAAAEAAKAVHLDIVKQMVESLREFAPASDAAIAVIEQQLIPPLAGIQNALVAADGNTAGVSTDQAISILNAVKGELDKAMQAVQDRAPVETAEFYAKSAAELLAATGPDLPSVAQRQELAVKYLATAWDRSIHRASNERLNGLTVMGSLFALYSTDADAAAVDGETASSLTAPAMREWGRLMRREPIDLTGTARDDVPAGYQDAIKAYFEALGAAMDSKPEMP